MFNVDAGLSVWFFSTDFNLTPPLIWSNNASLVSPDDWLLQLELLFADKLLAAAGSTLFNFLPCLIWSSRADLELSDDWLLFWFAVVEFGNGGGGLIAELFDATDNVGIGGGGGGGGGIELLDGGEGIAEIGGGGGGGAI